VFWRPNFTVDFFSRKILSDFFFKIKVSSIILKDFSYEIEGGKFFERVSLKIEGEISFTF